MKLLNKFFIALHVFIYRKSGGKLWGKEGGRDVLLMTTIGRKTGKARVNPVCYVPDGDGYLVLASAAGAPKRPGWYWNAVKGLAPVAIQIKDSIMAVHVVEIQGDERETAYEKYKQAMGVELINRYEKKAGIDFPLLRLTPQ
ncbi:MAG: nitroreductase family deazaflavin-dependent oxidoreductase [Chloroflexi bacterium]|nr:nitroreductase family deazaflavin-dependent oxidoreductase [Chloroflexota bacterium]